MTLKIDTLEIINDDVTSEKYGHYPEKRPIDVLLDNGIILLDKPSGPTSHEVVAWTKRILEIPKQVTVELLIQVLRVSCPLGLVMPQRHYQYFYWDQRNTML